jgi:hypothetical protein
MKINSTEDAFRRKRASNNQDLPSEFLLNNSSVNISQMLNSSNVAGARNIHKSATQAILKTGMLPEMPALHPSPRGAKLPEAMLYGPNPQGMATSR